MEISDWLAAEKFRESCLSCKQFVPAGEPAGQLRRHHHTMPKRGAKRKEQETPQSSDSENETVNLNSLARTVSTLAQNVALLTNRMSVVERHPSGGGGDTVQTGTGWHATSP